MGLSGVPGLGEVGARLGGGGEGGGVQWRLGRGHFAETLLSVKVPRWRRGLVSEPQELRQISPANPEGRAAGDRRGNAKGARRHGELKRQGHGCQTPTWREGGGVGGMAEHSGVGAGGVDPGYYC